MDELKIRGFENLIVDACNKTPIPNKVKYYVLREIAQKLLEASEADIRIMMSQIPEEQAPVSEEVEQNGD